MQLVDTKISTAGLFRCCIDTICALPDIEYTNNTIIDCKHETKENQSIILIDGVWKFNFNSIKQQ